jgi:hypothetical protein
MTRSPAPRRIADTFPAAPAPFGLWQPRLYADGRDETDACECSTPGCAVDHTAEDRAGYADRGCEGW